VHASDARDDGAIGLIICIHITQ